MAQENTPKACFAKALNQPVDLLAMHDAWPQRYAFLLESADGSSKISRYDLLLFSANEQLSLDRQRGLSGNFSGFDPAIGFLDNLSRWQRSLGSAAQGPLLFNGGWFLYLGYELAAEIEPSLQLPPAPGKLPIAFAARCPAAVIHDRQSGIYYVVAETDEQLNHVLADIRTIGNVGLPADSVIQVTELTEGPTEQFLQSVARIREYIVAGDVFQVNLSRAWQGNIPAEATDAAVYRQLRSANPAPFAGLMTWQGSTVFSSSPERLVEARDGIVQTRPIAGTRARSHADEADDHERSDLVTHPKERAEHIMLIDLERNDLGRICQPGSVEVDELMALETYAHVHHIVSNVRGQLRSGTSAGDIIRAVFPGGTITGCPKVRCMEIIAELEEQGRGYYTGAMGYLDRNGNMDLNILIRCLERQGDKISFRTGAGIVADSVAENELQETRAKARGLLKALNAE